MIFFLHIYLNGKSKNYLTWNGIGFLKYAAWSMRFFLYWPFWFCFNIQRISKIKKTSFVYISLFSICKEMIFFVLLLCFLLKISYKLFTLFFWNLIFFLFCYSWLYLNTICFDHQRNKEKKKEKKLKKYHRNQKINLNFHNHSLHRKTHSKLNKIFQLKYFLKKLVQSIKIECLMQ